MSEFPSHANTETGDGFASARSEGRQVASASPLAVESESPLIAAVIAALQAAAKVQLSEEALLVEERNTWEPESWLIHCCWQTLADAATGNEALELAALIAARHPNAPLQALYRLAAQYHRQPALGPLLQHELQRWHYRLFYTHPEEANQIERLLLVATSAALADDLTLAAACLERLDNQPKGWERVVARPDLREQLALCVVNVGPHPLVNDLINIAIRRFDDAGALFLHTVTTLLVERIGATQGRASTAQSDTATQSDTAVVKSSWDESAAAKWQRLLDHCLETVRNSTLVSMQSRRVAAMIMGQAGEINEVLVHLETIERVQAAQRETGYTTVKDDPALLRQVKRTNADRDVDFLVYTLRNAIDAMPIRQVNREDRILLSNKLALLGVQSDGWTAAGAAATLVALGALRYAAEVIDHISPHDPSRSEGLLTLVRSLMAVGEYELAAEQAKRAVDWAESLPMRNPERALTWGLAEIYLQHHQPTIALQLLARWREPTGWRETLRKLWREQLDDDGLRNSRLRFQAILQLDVHNASAASDSPAATNTVPSPFAPRAHGESERTVPRKAEPVGVGPGDVDKERQTLLRTLRRAAPRLLDGEALIHFYIDGLLHPLLETGHFPEAWALLPDLKEALCALTGNRQTARVQEVAILFQMLLRESHQSGSVGDSAPDRQQAAALHPATVQPLIEGFLRDLWRAGVERGLWQVVHTVEGTLPLLLQLEGPSAIVAIAQAANALQRVKLPPLSTPLQSSPALRTR
ncbi:MAG: hypothetical protein KDE19_12970 [Caldilineaceae bacterium]|nr:hypothetical protein [Caldilineaceae bacterium]